MTNYLEEHPILVGSAYTYVPIWFMSKIDEIKFLCTLTPIYSLRYAGISRRYFNAPSEVSKTSILSFCIVLLPRLTLLFALCSEVDCSIGIQQVTIELEKVMRQVHLCKFFLTINLPIKYVLTYYENSSVSQHSHKHSRNLNKSS